MAILGRLLDVTGSRADVLAAHRTVLAVFLGALLATLVCSAFAGDAHRPVRAAAETVRA